MSRRSPALPARRCAAPACPVGPLTVARVRARWAVGRGGTGRRGPSWRRCGQGGGGCSDGGRGRGRYRAGPSPSAPSTSCSPTPGRQGGPASPRLLVGALRDSRATPGGRPLVDRVQRLIPAANLLEDV